jgi:alkyl sulfatase BDS1-like metallo-beta-lactamase superfamily hydrolase
MGQGLPFSGKQEIIEKLTQIRDAAVYVHDEILKGIDGGKDVWQLMQEIRPPDSMVGSSERQGKK